MPSGRFYKPIIEVDKNYILSKVNKNDKRERYYKVVRLPLWNGQLVVSMYYRFLVINGNLFTEAKFFLLPPLKKKYLNIGNIPTLSTTHEIVKHLIRSIFTGAFSWMRVYWCVLKFIGGGFLANHLRFKNWKKEVQSNRLYNYGWNKSLRETWSSATYEHYFQSVDKDFTLKILTNELLTSLLHYLSEKNIATDQFKKTTTKIYNEGIIITGGDVKADSLSVGKGASIANNIANKAKGD